MADTQQWVKRDFTCDQGSNFTRLLKFRQVAAGAATDLTGCLIDMQIREGVADSGAPVVKTLSNRAGSIGIRFCAQNTDGTPNLSGTPDPTNGWVVIEMTATETQALVPSRPPKTKTWPAVWPYWFDIEITDAAGHTQRRLAGGFNLSLEVTRI